MASIFTTMELIMDNVPYEWPVSTDLMSLSYFPMIAFFNVVAFLAFFFKRLLALIFLRSQNGAKRNGLRVKRTCMSPFVFSKLAVKSRGYTGENTNN